MDYIESVLSASLTQYDYESDSLRQLITDRESFGESSLRFSTFINHKFNAKNTLRVGGIYALLGYDLFNEFYVRNQDAFAIDVGAAGSTNFYQGYANWQFRPSNNLAFNTGLHLSHFELNKDVYVEPRIGLRWKVGDQFFTADAGLHSRMETTAIYLGQTET